MRKRGDNVLGESGAINYPFVVHFHQPVGQLERILSRVYKQSYELWLRIFEQHPKTKFSVHFSGCLLEWIAENHPEYVVRLETLAKKGQIEFIGGGYYEPILPMIPDADKGAQIQLLSDYLVAMFRAKPVGLWLAERVWEPSLPKLLAESGMHYVLIDDYHIRAAGYPEEQTFYVYNTEEQGSRVTVFPINERLRYLMLWEPQEKSIDYLRQARTPAGDRIVVYITDAEKYGEWSEPAMAEQWLHQYLTIIEETPWIVSIHLSEYLQKYSPKGLVYVPCAAYDKMMEWSGGNFRNFLSKYTESNNMHKKMLYVRNKIEEASGLRCRTDLLAEARKELYAAQCNDAYWHGLFGGVYLPNLRQAVHANLIRAEILVERAVEEKVGPQQAVTVVNRDLDYDGQAELLLEGRRLNAYIKPDNGGNLFELDYKGDSIAHNFAGALTRRPEKYHEKWEQKPIIDWYRRTLLRDHLLRRELTLDGFLNMEHMFDQGDFILERFEHKTIQKEKEAIVKLSRTGHDWSKGAEAKLQITKTIAFPLESATLSVLYEVENVGNQTLSLRFAPESTLTPPVTFEYTPTPEELQNYPCSIGGKKNLETNILAGVAAGDAENCSVTDKARSLRIQVSWSPPTEVWMLPLQALAQTEKTPMAIYEGTTIMPVFRLELAPNDAQTINLELQINETCG